MKYQHQRLLAAGSLAVAVLFQATTAQAVDEEAARALARESNCFKCHSISKKGDGPAWKDVAAKYRGKPDAEAQVTKHITSGEKVKFEDGHEEEHKTVKSKDPAQIKNLVDFILSR